eukprot:1143075-Pelagomonas_calceolata.AAC.3
MQLETIVLGQPDVPVFVVDGMTSSSFCPFLRSTLANMASTSTLVVFTDDAHRLTFVPPLVKVSLGGPQAVLHT